MSPRRRSSDQALITATTAGSAGIPVGGGVGIAPVPWSACGLSGDLVAAREARCPEAPAPGPLAPQPVATAIAAPTTNGVQQRLVTTQHRTARQIPLDPAQLPVWWLAPGLGPAITADRSGVGKIRAGQLRDLAGGVYTIARWASAPSSLTVELLK